MDRWQLEPAADFGLSPRARLESLQREAGLVASATHLLWRVMSRAYLAGAHRLVVTGRENLPPAPPYVLVANHASHLDTVALGACLPARHCNRTFPIAAGDTFFERLAVSVFAALAMNALPLRRKKVRPADLAALRQRLLDGAIYILFPEGTRTRDGTMAAFKPGIGRLVAGSAVPVVPCWIDGAFAALPPHRRLPRPTPLRVTIGKPLAFAETPDEKAGWMTVAAALEAAVRELAAAAAARSRREE
jgi:1-acyl-sn-glycerol-3-phosphate acyltransferase